MTYLSRCVVLILWVSPFAMADTVLDELSICAKNDDSLQRLVCYDSLADKMKNSQLKPQQVQHQVPLQITTDEPLKREDNTAQSAQEIQSNPVLPEPKQPQRSHIIKPQATVDVAHEVNQQQANFGQENKQRTEDLIKQIQATIIRVKKAHYGELIITLDNGQIWRQTDGTRLKLKKDQVIIIKRGAMGSFLIGKENANKRMRAKRVK